MNILNEILFPAMPTNESASWILLLLRLIFGGLMLTNGIIKIKNYKTLVTQFQDPFGLGHKHSLQLAIFAEAICSLAVLTGLLFRLALLPQIFTMCVASGIIMRKAPFTQRQLPLSYLMVMLLMLLTGPGKFSLDYLIGQM